MNSDGTYSESEISYAFNKRYRRIVYDPKLSPERHPKAVLLGGQSGAGKTKLHGIFGSKFAGNVIVINGDEYRSQHPRYYELDREYGPDAVTHTAPWAGEMTERLIASLSALRYNLVIEGTLRTSEVPLSTAKALGEKGYEVSLALMAVKPDISLVSCTIRYEEMRLAGTVPRATDPAHHRAIVDAISQNLAVLESSGLFAAIELYTRAGDKVYPSKDEQGTAADALREVLFGPWTAEEREHLRYLEDKLERLKARV